MRSRELATSVRENNRIRFDSLTNRDPMKDKILPADLPEMVLVVRNMNTNYHNTSSSSMCSREYAWQMSCGDYRYAQLLAPLEWELFCAMSGYAKTLFGLKWRGQNFVKRMTGPNGATGLSDTGNNRNIVGWSAVWAVTVEMHFEQALLDTEIEQKGD